MVSETTTKRMTRLAFTLLILLTTVVLAAQDRVITISGVVKDAETGEALPFAAVQVKGTGTGTTTNRDGYFTIHKAPAGSTALVVRYVGYDQTEIILSSATSDSEMIIEIKPVSTSLEEVVVTAEREEIMHISTEQVSTIKMTPRKLEQLPNIGEKDLMRSFQLMPGISASNESSSGLYVRGGTPDQNLIVYDGFTIYHVDHLYGFFSAFNANAIKDVQLYKGGFESKFGGRLSSVTEITGKDGNQKRFNIGGDISLLSFNAFAEVPIGDKFSSILAFRKSYKGFIYNTIFDQFNEELSSDDSPQPGGGRFTLQETTLSSYFYDLNGKITFRPSGKDIISLSIFNGTDHLDNGYEIETPQMLADRGIDFDMKISDLTNYGNLGTGLKWSRKWSPRLYSNAVISYSNYYSDRIQTREGTITRSGEESNSINNGNFEENNLKDYSVKFDLQWDVSQLLKLEMGTQITNYDIRYDFIQDDTVTILDKDDTGGLGALYLQGDLKLLDEKMVITPGIRMSHFDVTQQLYFEPRLSAVYRISDVLSVNSAFGRYYQFANRIEREDISAGSRDFWVLSNGYNIPVSSSMHLITGLSYELPRYLFSIEGYYKTLDGLSEYTLRYDVDRSGLSYEENFYNGNGYARGVEFLAQRKSGNLKGWLSYTLGEAMNQFDIHGPDYFPASQDVTHEFKAVALFSHKRWDFSATWIYTTGRPYTAPSGAYSITLVDGTTEDYFSTTAKNSLRLPDYHRLDLSVNFRLFKPNTAGVFEPSNSRDIGYISFSIFNVYNRINTWYKQYEIIEGEVVETSINYLGFMPNITLSLKLH